VVDTSLLNYNVGPPQLAGGNVQADRPYPAFGQMRVLDYHGASIYQGVLVHFQHRLSHGLSLTVSYSLSMDRDNQGGGTNQERNQTQNAFQKVWANGLTEQRNNLVIAAIYKLPRLNPRRKRGGAEPSEWMGRCCDLPVLFRQSAIRLSECGRPE
jgi:hypothetical protein